MNSYLSSGDIAPQIIFGNGPGVTSYGSARRSLYGWGSVPTFQIDGVSQQVGWNKTNVQNYINARLAVPSYVSISTNVVGNASGGTVYYTITVEQNPGVTGPFKIWSAVLESHEIASPAYGVYDGQELMWEPRAFPLGASGTQIQITGPYPQTIHLSQSYTLDPVEHVFNNLDLITYVQAATGTHEVLNAAFSDLPDTATGIEGPDEAWVQGSSSISAWPNPCFGRLDIGAVMPSGVTGTVTVFDITGHRVSSFDAAGSVGLEMDQPGVYIARLETTAGGAVSTRFTVIR